MNRHVSGDLFVGFLILLVVMVFALAALAAIDGEPAPTRDLPTTVYAPKEAHDG